jgi:hypothetical protein
MFKKPFCGAIYLNLNTNFNYQCSSSFQCFYCASKNNNKKVRWIL